MTFTSKKKVLVIRNILAINAGIQTLLSGKQDVLEVYGLEFHDQKELFRSITRISPDVIIADDEIVSANLAELLMFLQGFPNMRTIIMSLKENVVHVYDTKQIPIQHIGDFLAVIYFPGTR